MVDLAVKLGPVTLKNPVLVASGTFGYARESKDLVDLDAFGGIITKSITLKPREGNPPPRIAELPAGMLNSIGLANVGVDGFIREKMPFLRTLNTIIIVNVAGATAEEYLQVVERLEEVEGIHGYELNFSCPNVKEGGLEFSQNAIITRELTERVRRITRRLLIIKLTPNITRVSEIAKAAEEGGADAISLINSLVGLAVDIQTRRPKISTTTAGYSGPAIKPVALAKVYEAAQVVKIPIIGIGGIMTGEDAVEFLIVGATAIQVGTANFIDPSTGLKIVDYIRSYCQRYGFKNPGELIGTLKPWES